MTVGNAVAGDAAERRVVGAEGHGRLVRGEGRNPEMVAFERSLVCFFVDAAELLGVPKSVAAIYGICFASPEPLGFSEIQERLDISAGSISQGIRVLREIGALKPSEPADPSTLDLQLSTRTARAGRAVRYEPDLGLRKVASHFIEQRLERQLSSGRESLQFIAKRVPGNDNGAKLLKSRLKALQTWHDQARAVLPIVRTFLKLT